MALQVCAKSILCPADASACALDFLHMQLRTVLPRSCLSLLKDLSSALHTSC